LNDRNGDFICHPDLRRLFGHWLALSVAGQIPLRRDVDPLAFRDLMPNLQLLDVGATPDDLRYRLVGSEIAATFGFEPRGMSRGEIRRTRVTPDKYADFDRTSRETHDIARRGVVAYTHDHMTSYNLDFLAYARLMMPVSEDGARITGIFGALIMSSGGDGFWRNFRDLHVEVPIESLGLRTDGSAA
jgi:hypothetical protein